MPPMLAAVSHRSHAKETAPLTSSAEQAENPEIGKPRLIADPWVCGIPGITSDGVAAFTLSQLRHAYHVSRKKISGVVAHRALKQRGERKILGRSRLDNR
jgi:hypothetical protein